MKYIKKFFKTYPHIYTFIIGLFLLIWFETLEKLIPMSRAEHIMHVKLDDYIPFVKYFIVPYIFWFFYIGITLTYLFFASRDDFLKLSAFLYIGMGICYLTYMIYPNGQDLRPILTDTDFFTRWVQLIYNSDTPTNCFPSIHVIDSIAVHSAIMHYEGFKNNRLLKISSFIAMCLICISTMTLKQHSCVDVFAGIGLSAILYVGIYKIDWETVWAKIKAKKSKSKSNIIS